jgi:hypothetical protein
MTDQPTLNQIVWVLRRSLEIARDGWIGEAEEYVKDLLSWIDGDDDGLARWAERGGPDWKAPRDPQTRPPPSPDNKKAAPTN